MPRKTKSPQEKLDLIARYKMSGMSRLRFAKSVGVPPSTFMAWVSAHEKSLASSRASAPKVVELVPTVERLPAPGAPSGPVIRYGNIECTFPHIPSAAYLAELLKAL